MSKTSFLMLALAATGLVACNGDDTTDSDSESEVTGTGDTANGPSYFEWDTITLEGLVYVDATGNASQYRIEDANGDEQPVDSLLTVLLLDSTKYNPNDPTTFCEIVYLYNGKPNNNTNVSTPYGWHAPLDRPTEAEYEAWGNNPDFVFADDIVDAGSYEQMFTSCADIVEPGSASVDDFNMYGRQFTTGMAIVQPKNQELTDFLTANGVTAEDQQYFHGAGFEANSADGVVWAGGYLRGYKTTNGLLDVDQDGNLTLGLLSDLQNADPAIGVNPYVYSVNWLFQF